MKVAIFHAIDGSNVIILAVKGRGNKKENIDGFDEWFNEETGFNIKEYEVTLAHIGAGDGIQIICKMKLDWLGRDMDITDEFHDGEEE
jgi:hypothetical protein